MTLRGCGFHSDPDEIVSAQLIAYHARALVGAAPSSLPASFSWRAMLPTLPGGSPDMVDQGRTSACVGAALSSSILLRSHISGNPIKRPSVKAIYDLARMQAAPRAATLFDGGCSPTDAINGIKEYGLVAEWRWPLQDQNAGTDYINAKPPLDVFHHGLEALLGQHYRIAPGRGAAQLLREALFQGYIPTFAMDVFEDYQSYDGSAVYRSTGGHFVGRHMQAIVGWAEDYFEVLNSWGLDWGDAGFSRIADSFIESRGVDSLLVPTVIPLSVS